jgi:ribosomal protein S12 methylthiotransferase accessory factor
MSINIFFDGRKKVNASINGFTIETDQSVHSGGDNSAPEPFTLFLASLGTCAGIYVKGFCDQRQIESKDIRLSMDYIYDPVQKMIGTFLLDIHVPADFPEQYEAAVVKTASLCAVKQHLHPAIETEIKIVKTGHAPSQPKP